MNDGTDINNNSTFTHNWIVIWYDCRGKWNRTKKKWTTKTMKKKAKHWRMKETHNPNHLPKHLLLSHTWKKRFVLEYLNFQAKQIRFNRTRTQPASQSVSQFDFIRASTHIIQLSIWSSWEPYQILNNFIRTFRAVYMRCIYIYIQYRL